MNSASPHELRRVKIVVVGPFDVGKTTFLRSVSPHTVVTTERSVSETDESLRSAAGGDRSAAAGSTTVAMEFSRVPTSSADVLLFGSPGQRRFSFMWDVLANGMHGWVLLVDASRPETLDEAIDIHRRFSSAGRPGVVGVNKCTAPGTDACANVRRRLGVGDRVEVVAVDARDRSSAHGLLERAVAAVDAAAGHRGPTVRLRGDG